MSMTSMKLPSRTVVSGVRAPLGVKLPKGMYHIHYCQVGKTTLYLQPSGTDEFNRYYEAPFNLLP